MVKQPPPADAGQASDAVWVNFGAAEGPAGPPGGCWRRFCLWGLLGVLGGLAAATFLLKDRLSVVFLACLAVLAALAVGVVVHRIWSGHTIRESAHRTGEVSATPTTPLLILYTPPEDSGSLPLGQLEEKLLDLCKQDRELFQRLLNQERSRRPHLERTELVRLALDNFERDNQ